jgi:predicted kinase
MSNTTPPTRSVKIAQDERGGWSSDRPRRDGAPPRPADVSVRGRLLKPSDSLRYSPGSLLIVVSSSPAERDAFTDRLIDNKGSLLSLDKVRGLLSGRVADDELEGRAAEVLNAAVLKRLEANETVVVAAESLEPDERERYVRMADRFKRPRHVILLETPRDQVEEDDRPALNDLRRRLSAGEMGAEGFDTSLRLSGSSTTEVKRIAFERAPRD